MRRSTVIYLLLFVAMAGSYYYLNHRQKPAADILVTPGPQVSYLFDANEGEPVSIHIKSKAGEIVEVARGADNAWALKLPIEAKADQGASEAAASQVTAMRILDTIPDIDLETIGLKAPEYILTIKFTSGVERKAEIGVITPTESGYYVRNADGKILIVTKSSLDALLSMLTTPPYLETLTPSPIPATATQTPLPPSGTPEAGTATNETTTPKP